MTEQEKKFEYWLAAGVKLSDRKKQLLRESFQSAEDIYYIEEKALHEILFLNDTEKNTLIQARENWKTDEKYEALKKQKIDFVVFYEERYPKGLLEISDFPYALYVKGNLPDENKLRAAMVGARNCTAYGEQCALEFAGKLAERQIQIISGMAKGIDGHSQRGAILAGGKTFAVLGCGVDICYPREHIGLYMDILNHGGGILSEFPPGEQPLPWHFPLRNRIISGLSDMVLVMEAREKSGSLITADIALEQGKDVYALPGPVTSSLSKGCNRLIQQGAGILLSPENFMEEIGILKYKDCVKSEGKTEEKKKMLERTEELVYSSLGLFARSASEIVEETALPAQKVLRILASLEIQGYIKEISKNYYIRV